MCLGEIVWGVLGVDCSRSPFQQNEGYTEADGAAKDALDDNKEESFIIGQMSIFATFIQV